MTVWMMFLTPSWLTRALTRSRSLRTTAAMEDTRQRGLNPKCHPATRVLWRRFLSPSPLPRYLTTPTAAASCPAAAGWPDNWTTLTTSSALPSCLTPGAPECSPPLPSTLTPAPHPATWAGQHLTLHQISILHNFIPRTASSSMFSDSGYGGLSKRNSGAFSSTLDSSFSSSRTSPESVDRERARGTGVNKISLGSLKYEWTKQHGCKVHRMTQSCLELWIFTRSNIFSFIKFLKYFQFSDKPRLRTGRVRTPPSWDEGRPQHTSVNAERCSPFVSVYIFGFNEMDVDIWQLWHDHVICFQNLNKVRVIVALCHVDARSDQIRVDSCLGAYISLPLLSAYFNLSPPSIFDNALSFEPCHKTAVFFANLTTNLCDCIYTCFFLITLF